ncbi:MAG: class I SAM-dependent methyltransferase [Candidatus Woesearchaeota archaeon]|nr:MAG: class I SAM-dependent methyltransferase [Candidatus Woesearchaeota archaeon]
MSLKELAPNYYVRLKKVIELVGSGKRVLDIGCGDGFLELSLKKRFNEVYGIDVNESDLIIARSINPEKKIHFVKSSATKLPLKNNFFDVVVCTEVIEHIKEDEKVISEIRRVLKKKGTLIITTPDKNFPFIYDPINYILMRLFSTHIPIGLWGFGHVKLYNRKDMENLLVGFKIQGTFNAPHVLTGLIENYYLTNILQPITKSDPKNKERSSKDIKTLRKRVLAPPPKLLTQVRDFFINLDNYFYKNKPIGINLIVKAVKV